MTKFEVIEINFFLTVTVKGTFGIQMEMSIWQLYASMSLRLRIG